MTERPILFSDAMVRAILSGAKTQTRRLVKPQDCVEEPTESHPQPFLHNPHALHPCDYSCGGLAPYAVPGDRLWVREAFASFQGSGVPVTPSAATYVVLRDGTQVFRSDSAIIPPAKEYADGAFDHIKWRPSIHMPRWACRLVLEVTEVRVERLQAITEEDARAEGVEAIGAREDFRGAFVALWESINGARAPWEANPWVWVVLIGG